MMLSMRFLFLVVACLSVLSSTIAMNKGELIDAIAKDAGVSHKGDVNRIMEGFAAYVRETLFKKGDKVSLFGFGTFSPHVDDDDEFFLCDGVDDDCDGPTDDVDFTISRHILLDPSSPIYTNFLLQFYTSLSIDLANIQATPFERDDLPQCYETKEEEKLMREERERAENPLLQGENALYEASNKRQPVVKPGSKNPDYFDPVMFVRTQLCLNTYFFKILQVHVAPEDFARLQDPRSLLVPEKRKIYNALLQTQAIKVCAECGVNVSGAFESLADHALCYDEDSEEIKHGETESMDRIYKAVAEMAPSHRRHGPPSVDEVEQVLTAMMKNIIYQLNCNQNVDLGRFGSFSVSKRAARTGRNPQTGNEIKIAAKNVVRFKAGKALSNKVN